MVNRRRIKISKSDELSLPLTTNSSNNNNGVVVLIGMKRRWNIKLLLSYITGSILLIILLIIIGKSTGVISYLIQNIETPIGNDPYLRAKIFNPIQTLSARYFDSNSHPTSLQTFHLSSDNAFVINLARDQQRLQTFRSINKSVQIIQRFDAHEWSTTNSTLINIQEKWKKQYPFIHYSSSSGNIGDAACALSHVLLWEEMLINSSTTTSNISSSPGLDYLFVFEDDAQILKPLSLTLTVDAPNTADIVLLTNTATKRVDIPWRNNNNNNSNNMAMMNYAAIPNVAVRVLGGWGTMGYIITKQGAIKLLQYMKKSKGPIDLSFYDVTVYLSTQWPLVRHYGSRQSTRLSINAGGK